MAVAAKKATPPTETPTETATELSVMENKKPVTPAANRPKPQLAMVAAKPAPAPQNKLLHWAMSALEHSRANTFLCDKEWNILFANQKAMDILEFMEPNLHKHSAQWQSFRAKEVVGSSLDFLFTDEPMEFRRASDPRNHPYQHQIKTGPCVCDVQVTGIKDEKGELIGYSVDWERITDKLANEKRTKQLLTVLENASTNTFLCDLDWNIVYANKRSFEVLAFMEPNLHKHSAQWQSFRASDIVGNSLKWLFTDEPQEFTRASDKRNHPYQKVIKTGPCVCDVSITGTYDEDGQQNGYAVSWERVTEKVAAEKRQAQLLGALDSASTSVMVADSDLKLIYMNKKLTADFKRWEPELQKMLGSGFRADALLGRCIDEFHKNPEHQRRMLSGDARYPLQSQLKIGPYTVDLSINILKNDRGETVGFCTEWFDITERLKADAEYKANVKEIADRMEFLRGACSTDLANAMDAMAKGDLTFEIVPRTPLLDMPPQPDLAVMAQTFNDLRNQTVNAVEAYKRAQEALSGLVAQTQVSADTIAQASTEVSTGTDDLSQRTEEQASSLEETASSMEQMTSTVKQNADNARQANQLAAQASEVATKGGQVVNNAVTSMEEINKASKRIADIISVIDEIAFQTNLLALNAAVEAARVGEQGRGFAVVAAEVRNLAGRSATAAKEIKALVQDSVQKVQEGSNLVNQSGQTLDEIVTSVKKVADIIAEITAASQEQAAGIEQVNKAIMQMDQITQQNAALVEETAAASQAMTQQAADLRSVVAQFRLDPSFVASIMPTTQAAPPARPKPVAPAARPAPVAARAARPVRAAAPSDEGFEEF